MLSETSGGRPFRRVVHPPNAELLNFSVNDQLGFDRVQVVRSLNIGKSIAGPSMTQLKGQTFGC